MNFNTTCYLAGIVLLNSLIFICGVCTPFLKSADLPSHPHSCTVRAPFYSMVIKLVVFILLGGLFAILQRQSAEAKSPHILFIVADDLGKFFLLSLEQDQTGGECMVKKWVQKIVKLYLFSRYKKTA